MFAMVTHGHRLVWEQVASPELGPHEVLIEVVAAGVNRADLLQLAGHYPPPPGASDILGLECSGTVAAVGAGVTQWAPGDHVCALLPGGGYAQLVAVDAGLVLPVPKGVSLPDAAALPEAVITAWSALGAGLGTGLTAEPAADVGSGADTRPGATVLITGGSGGVGTMAVQLARHLRARVIATAGSRQRGARLEELGAWAALDYHGNVPAQVAALTDGQGVDMILDVMGAKSLADNILMLALDGRLVIIGMQSGTRAPIDLGVVLAKRLSVVGTTLRSRPLEQRRSLVAAVTAAVWPLLEDGTVRPVVDRTLPMSEALAAHALLEAGGAVFGKVVLTCS